MNHCQDEMKAAIKAGYWNLFSFNPALKAEGKTPFTLSSKPGDGSYQAFLANETRYSSLARKFPDRVKDLFANPSFHIRPHFQLFPGGWQWSFLGNSHVRPPENRQNGV